jgi:hypothetical protein
MSDALTYYAALKLLAKARSPLVSLLDSVATTGLTVWTATALAADKSPEAPMSILALKDQIVEFAQEIVQGASEWRTGVSRFTRSERLAAAHAVVVVSSYFEAFAQEDLPGSVERWVLSSSEQGTSTARGEVPEGYIEIIEFLLREPLPLPEPHRLYADIRSRLADCYARLSNWLIKLVSDLAVWDDLDVREKDALREAVGRLSARALDRYDNSYRLLAMDNKEFEIWAGQAEVHALDTALSGLSSLLAQVAIRRPGQRSRMHLAMSYQASLAEPVIGSGQAPDGVVLPPLGEAYVDPVCRVAEARPGDRPAEAEWWQCRELVPDIGTFLAGYLTSPRAATLPLVVLGEPGSGKSKLVEVLAARLPEHDFLPILVQLRDVAAESMIQEQIEQAIFRGPGKHVSWHDLREIAEGALPVVLLDGLDELIQATAVHRYDYLEQVRDFQLRQAQIGWPVAVVVTSRTAVADLVRFPRGSLALQLQPFTDGQVRRWLEIWDRHNSSVLAARRLRSLPAEIALAHRELTEQPLLLLLVAIFDAADNSLQRLDARLERTELYERLLTEFAFREIVKTARNRALPAERQRQLAVQEVQRLAVVALAMFARGQQAASEAELNQDLPVLFPEEDEPRNDSDMALTPAQRATGRFFFIHKSEARLHDERTRSYEFLHATFGEFLVARLAVSALRDIAAYREVMRRGITAAGQLDDGFLYASLSFSCLGSRTPIISFMREMLHTLPGDERARCREILNDLIAASLFPRPSRSFQHYAPIHYTVTRRLACYSANLVIMLVLLAESVSASEFCGPVDTGQKWAQYGYLWRSSFTSSEWRSLTDTIRAQVTRRDGPVEIGLIQEDGSPVSPTDSIILTEISSELTHFDVNVSAQEDVSYEAEIPFSSIAGRAFRDIAFTPDWHSSMLLLHTVPYIRAAGGELRYQLRDGTLTLPGYLLANLDYAREAPPIVRCKLYESCAIVMATSPELTQQFIGRLRQETQDFLITSVVEILGKINAYPPSEAYLGIVNALWQRANSESDRASVVELAWGLRTGWPDEMLTTLDEELRNLAGDHRRP